MAGSLAASGVVLSTDWVRYYLNISEMANGGLDRSNVGVIQVGLGGQAGAVWFDHFEVLRGPMGSTLHGSNAQSGIIHIFTKRGSRSKKPIVKMKTSFKSTEAPILDNGVANGEELSISMNGRGSSNVE